MTVKKAVFILGGIAVLGAVAIFIATRSTDTSEYSTDNVAKGSIVQTVSETGTVKAASEIDLGFLNAGKVAVINFKIGDQVQEGQVIAELDYSALNVSQREAAANLDVARQTLRKLQAGATSEEIAIARAGAEQAKTAYEAAKNELGQTQKSAAEAIAQAQKTLADLESSAESDVTTYEQAIATAKIALDNTKATYQRAIDNYKTSGLVTIEDKLAAANTALDAVNRVLTDEDAENLLSVKNPDYLTNTENDYSASKNLQVAANSSLSAAKSNQTNANVTGAMDDALAVLNKVFSALQNCFGALENAIVSSQFTQTELDTFKTSISTQKTAIAAAIAALQSAQNSLNDAILSYNTNVSTAEQSLAQAQAAYDSALRTARNALSSAQLGGEQQITAAQSRVDTAKEAWQVALAQLEKVLAPANQYDVSLYQARVRQAEAAVESINKQIENSMIKSPISGTITEMNYKIGEQFTMAGKPMASVLAENSFEIEVLISEADIAKVEVEDPTEVTLDAFGDDVKFYGKVVFIEPAETVIQDVIYYKVTVTFDNSGQNVKSGMTANVTITTAQKNNVLMISSRAVVEKNGSGKIVRVLENGVLKEKPVELGLRGDGGMVEVVSGLSEGEIAITFIKENN